MNCTSINFEGKEIKFSSDLELDLFLESIRDKYHIVNSDASLSVDMQKTTEEKLKSITDMVKTHEVEEHRINEDGDTEAYFKIPGSLGTTKAIQTITIPGGTSPLVTPFDKNGYFDKMRKEMKGDGFTDAQIGARIKDIENLWKTLTEYGTEIHSLFESIIKDDPSLYQQKYLNDNTVANLSERIKDFITHLKNIHGPKCKLLTEVPLMTNEIAEPYSSVMDSINGRADLIVIDEAGVAHIYDFKVSRKEVGEWHQMDNHTIKAYNWWHSTKKKTAGYQLAFYRAMLKQHGINVGTTAIVPVKIDPEYDSNNEYVSTGIRAAGLDVDSIVTSPTSMAQQNIVNDIIPVPHIEVDLTEVSEDMNRMFGEYGVSAKVQRYDARVASTKKRLMHLVSAEDRHYQEGFRFSYFDRFKGKTKYFKTEEELDESLEKYVETTNEQHGNEIMNLADSVYNACQGSMTLEEFGAQYAGTDIEGYIKKVFRPYILNGWELDLNKELLAAGLFVFKNHVDNVIEVVSLTDQHIFEEIESLGGSIFGNFKIRNYESDSSKTLNPTYGSAEAIKVLTLLNRNLDSWSKYKINSVSVHNIWEQKGEDFETDVLFDNYSKLTRYSVREGNPVQNNLRSKHFTDVVSKTMVKVKTALGSLKTDRMNEWPSADDMLASDEYFQSLMTELESDDKVRSMIQDPQKKIPSDSPKCVAWMELAVGRARIRGFHIYSENDIASLMHMSTGKGGKIYTGLNVNAPQNSPSRNVQVIAQLEAQAASEINRRTMSESAKLRAAEKKLHDYYNRSALWGGQIKNFDNLFVRDADGKIAKEFRLKNPADHSELSKEEVEFINTFLEVVNSRRYTTTEAIEQAKSNGSWFDVPLSVGSLDSHIHNSSLVEGVKSEISENWNPIKLLDKQRNDLDRSRGQGRAFNKFKLSSNYRTEMLTAHGTSHFETNLGDLGVEFIQQYVAEDVHNKYLPIMHGIQIALQYQQGMYGNNNEEVIKYIEKFITSNVYNQPIMDKHLQGPYKLLSTVKTVTTASALGFNFRSGLRELMQGAWIHLSRTMAEAYGRDQFTKSEIAQAWSIIFTKTIGDINTLTLIDALNVTYRMANADNNEIKTILSQSRAGIRNFDSDKLYFCNKFPDTYHRMGILVAKMIHDGCWEAHSMVDDQLVYDFSKDKRFDLLFKDGVDKNSEEYKKQHSLYTTMRMQFIKEGEIINEGDPLPRAYTTQEGNSIKSFSELCFGHYDKNTQMLAKKMFLGSMMLQFRTFISAKLEQWILKPGTYDQGHYVEVKDVDGVRLVRVYTEDENGNTIVEIKREDELTGNENWEPMIDWEGRFMEGILYSLWDFGKALVHWDTEELKKLWANPTKRANFKIFLWDMIWMHILMAIVGSLILYNDEVELNPVEWTFASALYTSFQDGPIDQIVQSMFSDLNPPMMSQVQNIFRQAGNMVTGDQGLGDTIVNTFGALAPLKHLEEVV